jgi:glycosyltransferase involved in cell wall biosynthesis
MKPLTVCMPTTTFPRWPGDGEGAFVWGLAHALVRRGVQVRVVALHSPGARTYEHIEGIAVFRPRYWWPENQELLRKEQAGLPVTLRKYPLARLQLFPFVAAHTVTIARLAQDSDLIHSHWTLSAGAALLGHRLHCRPLVATVQGSDIFQVPKHPVGAWLTRTVLNRCTKVTTLSKALYNATMAAGVSRNHLQIIPNGVDTEYFTPPPANTEREPLILFVGSLIERKGVRYLLQALPTVFAKLPAHRAVILGEGSQLAELRSLAKELDIASRVEFLGFLPQEGIRQYMRRACLLVLPSLEEGQGVVLLEAMASATPIIGSNVDGIRDVVTPTVGRLVPPQDPAALAQALDELLTDSAAWQEASQAARKRATSTYDWQLVAEQFLHLYESILVRGPLRRKD